MTGISADASKSITMSELSPFERDGVAVYRSVIAPQTLALIAAEYQIMLANDRLRRGDSQVDNSYAAYGLTVSDALMQTLAPYVEAKTGHAVFPTYSYGRIYLKGASLARHVDRPACEISVSLTVTEWGGKRWPLYCRTANFETVAIDLAPGDLVIYKGMEMPHWREPFEGDSQLQLFLHYVRQDGPHAQHRYDGRARLGAPSHMPVAPPKAKPLAVFRQAPPG